MSMLDKLTSFNFENNTGLVNMTCGFFALILKKLKDQEKRSILVVTPNMLEARSIYNKCLDESIILFEDDEIIYSDGNAVSPELKVDRINILNDLLNQKENIVITDIRGFLRKLSSPQEFKNRNISFKVNDNLSRENLILNLEDFGYEKTSIVEKMGDYAVRGFVIDIFPINEENPIRIELFGDDIESIKYFDIDSQKSTEKLEEILIIPFNEKVNKDTSSIFEYLDNPILIFKDYNQITFSYEKLANDSLELNYNFDKFYFNINDIAVNDKMYWFDFDSEINNIELNKVLDLKTKKVETFGENFDDINKYVEEELLKNKTIIISVSTLNLNDFLDKLSFNYVLTDFDNIFSNKVNIVKKRFSEGFEKEDFILLTDLELFGRKTVTYKKTRFKGTTRIRDLSKLEIGDYVVHSLHGIGIYNGIKTLKKNDIYADYLEVLYAKGDKLYIPASKIELISKYNGKDGYVPKVNSLTSSSWAKAKARIREKIKLEAERLIKVQAEREVKKGYSFSEDSPLQEMFENEFIYDVTKDQLKASEEIKKDMQSSRPMDRILCGDVGYGKTEVAFRAMFKAAFDGKQVLYLCPTTVLCRQQYEVATDRFKNYPVNIAILSRFNTGKEIKETISKLQNGEIDILFATHRGLSDDVVFKDLGLLVIDEEQRFGVIQKEKIKEMKSSVDVLTLTATPIPRTLQMAVLGIKNLSLIETPPKNRKAVATYVTPFDKKLVREIVYKEVSRGGQVFILYNRVEDIESKVRMFKELLPDVNINFAHGQMNKDTFEDVMNDFVSHKFDVLVCTTIIETGIDIPNVNSLIIMEADRFGLSQLYQIRGRVGRSDTLAYAYLMYEKGRVLTEKAVKRLKVIKEFTELGSGFNIAAKDLAIRGAGDILGSEQAGFIDSVGIDLYLKMLEEEVARIKGLEVEEDTEEITSTISSHIKDEYVSDEDIKIEIHKLINTIDSFDKLKEIKQIITDRFGKPDLDMEIYMNEILFEKITKKLGVTKIFDNSIYREVYLSKEMTEKINYEDLFMKALKINRDFNFSYKNKMVIIKLLYENCNKNPVFDFNKLLKELL